MKKIFKLTILAVLALFTAVGVNAQGAKFGHINSAELLASLPEVKDADKKLQDFATSMESQLKLMTNEYQSKVQAYQSQAATMADPIKDAKVKEISDLEARIQEFQQTAQESVTKKKEELYSPILKKTEDVIVEMAKEKGYAYVFDTSAGSVIYGQASDDMMDIVKKKLASLPATSPTAAPTTPVKSTGPKK
ncbi:MAG: OmpH family outer membrane protein [Sphingobacteriales bacterium]|jgi:outer membrane protein|nr:OmpH family outer membrane protein [Sphingobacteriales bacterium]